MNSIEEAFQRGLDLQSQRKFVEAEQVYRSILIANPKHAGSLHRIGTIALECGNPQMALQFISKAIEIAPESTACYANLAIAQCQLGMHWEATKSIEIALRDNPAFPEAWNTAAIAFWELDDNRAVNCFRNALRLNPNYTHALSNLGMTLSFWGNTAEGISLIRKAISIDNQYVDAQWNLALALLLDGQYEEGWHQYEWRKRMKKCTVSQRNFDKPQWKGEDLTGKILYIHQEQGFGDTIQFARFIDKALEVSNCARCFFEVQPALESLFLEAVSSENTQQVELYTTGKDIPEFDYHCPLLSLPGVFGTNETNIPNPIEINPYTLTYLPPGTNIGLCWFGNRDHEKDRKRSIAWELIKELNIPDCNTWSLAKDWPHDGHDCDGISDYCSSSQDFLETAKRISLLDLVITVDTAIAHLAASMGKPTWVMLPYAPDWRWGFKGETTLWYPTMRLFRQSFPGDWQGVISKVKGELAKYVVRTQTQ